MSIVPELFVLAQPKKSFQLRIEIADKHEIVGMIAGSFKQAKVWIRIWAVNGFDCYKGQCQSPRLCYPRHLNLCFGILYLITRPCFTPPLVQLNSHFLLYHNPEF